MKQYIDIPTDKYLDNCFEDVKQFIPCIWNEDELFGSELFTFLEIY